MSVITNNLLLGEDGYNISRSVRLRSSASAYFSRTPAGFGASTQTMSFWFKRGNVSGSAVNPIRSSYYDANNYSVIAFDVSAGKLTIFQVENGTTVCNKATDAVYRDPSAWYHVVINTDLSRSSGDKNRIYVNGVLQSCTGTDNQTYQLWPYTAYTQVIGYAWASGTYLDGYLTEVNFIDGQALTPSSFGETDLITGVWKPKKYAGTYGTNGFFLNFSDNNNNTAATIGKDSSGNGNNWTPNNISVTSGSTYDSMLDVPTMWADGGNGRGNYCVLSPLDKGASSSTIPSDGNLTFTLNSASGSAPQANQCATFAVSSGKWYWEATFTSITAGGTVGIVSTDFPMANNPYTSSSGQWLAYLNNGNKENGSTASAYGASYTTNDVIGVALDLDAGTITFYKNNTSQGTAFTGISGTYKPHLFINSSGATSAGNINFGQRPFAYTPPTGFKALNTQNLPDATIKKGNAYFDVSTWTGNGSSQSITNNGAMQPDFLWYKDRSAVSDHRLFDSVRGVTKALYSDATDAETTEASALTSFNSNGFTLGSGSGNTNTRSFVGWQWKESVSAGFDIVTYTFSTAGTNTINHSLGVAPKMIIMKDRTTGYNWDVYHASVGYTQRLILNSTGAATSGFWAAAPTSTQFSVTNTAYNNNDLVVAYLFAEVAGYSKFGSYTGNGSTDGPFVYCGFRPRFVLIKRSDAGAENWWILDTSRDPYNTLGNALYPNNSGAESAGYTFDFLSNGFKIRTYINTSGGTYIYAAFAENPFKNSLAR